MSSNTGTCAAVRNAVTHGFAHVVALILAASAASTVAASTGPTVKEVVEFTRIVQPMHHDQDALQEQRSPDGQKAFIVTRQSNVQTDRNRFEILLLDLNVQRLREKRALPPKPLLSLQSRNDPDDADAAIQDVRWINDKTIVFRAHVEDRPAQVYRIDVTGGRAIRLTREPLGVVSFDISADLRRVLYVTPVPNPAVRHGARSVVVGAQSFWSVNFPQAGLRTQQRWYRYVVAEAGSRAPPRTLGGKFAESSSGRPAASLSPDGRWALVPRYEPGRQAAWAEQYPEVAEATEKYGPSAKLDPLGYYSRPFSYVPRRLVAYRLKDGKEHLVVDSPDDSLPGNQSRGDRLWMQTGASVVIAGTYLPRASGASKDKSGSHIIEYWPDSGKWKDIAALDGRLTGALRAEGRGDAFIAIDGKQRRRFERKTDGAWFEQPDIDRGSDIEAVALRVDESLNRPADIAATMPNGESVRLTHLNPQFSSATWGSIQPYDWKDAKGRTWRGGLMTPAVLDAKTRHALVIQPYGFSASRFYLDGANTYTGFTSGFAGRAFMRENILVLALPWSSVGSEEMAEHEGIVSFSEGVRSAIDALVAEGWVDREKVGLMGWSSTGERVLNLITFSDVPIRAASLLDGDANTLFSMTITYAVMDGIQSRKEQANVGGPFGDSRERWVRNDPSLHTDCVRAALRIETYGPETHNNWDIYALLRRQYRPVEMIVMPQGSHALARPSERMTSLQGNVDWYRFWLRGEERTEPTVVGESAASLKEQYARWRQLVQLKNAADLKPECKLSPWLE